MMDEDFEPGVRGAALISAAQRVEHYEIVAYGCVRTWAGLLGEKDATDSGRRKRNRSEAYRALPGDQYRGGE
jgi:ferritin-like metal-binding protein YciE